MITKKSNPLDPSNRSASLYFLSFLLLATFSCFSQVGIGTTTPNASTILDIEAADKGILIPRVSLANITTTMLDGTNPAAIGLLIYNSNAAVTGGDGVGYYSFNGTTWEKLLTSSSGGISDADFYEEGTTSPPDDITDDIFTQGNVAIGKNTADYTLDLETNSGDRVINSLLSGATNGNKAGHYVEVSTTGNGTHSGTQNVITSVSGGSRRGTYNQLTGTNSSHYGVWNSLSDATGTQTGTLNSLSGNGTGDQVGVVNHINTSGNGNKYGVRNNLNEDGSGVQTGVFNQIVNASTGEQYGVRNQISSSSNLSQYGLRTDFSNSGNGKQYGVYSGVSSNGSGDHYGYYSLVGGNGNGINYGIYNNIQTSGTPNQYGAYNFIRGSGNGSHFGSYQEMTSDGSGTQYGIYNNLLGPGSGIHYGTHNLLSGIGSGDKYANYNEIETGAGGIHFGVYSKVLKTGSFAGYFLGNVSIGTTTANNYVLPASRGTANQVIQTDGSGNVDWVDAASLGVERINDLTDGKSDNDGSDNGSSIFLGINAGLADDASDNGNVGIGFESLKSNTIGYANTATGYQSLFNNNNGNENTANGTFALYSNTSGTENTAVGFWSLYLNQQGNANTALGIASGYQCIGDLNVFLGFSAGYNETGSNKLYIENSNASADNALIYGEFDNNILRINGELQLGLTSAGRYAFPTADGTANQILQTNGSGQLSWMTPTTGDITGVNAGAGLTGGGTTGTVTLNVVATNGLTVNANNIVLGGTLTQATTITQGTNNYTHNLNSTGDFIIQDNGTNHFELRDNGNMYLGGNTYWNNGNTSGNPLARLYWTGTSNNSTFELYKDAVVQHQFNSAGTSVINELGQDFDFRIEGNNNANLFYVDAGNDVVSFGRNDPTLTGNGTTVNGATLDFVADFELASGGTTIGLGSAEYVADVGANLLAFSASLLPSSDNTRDLGSATLRWDDVYATNGTIQTSDIRDKKNITEISYGLNELLALNPIRFQWKKSHDPRAKLGFSAQQLQKIIPEVVKDYDYEFPENGAAPIKKQNDRLGVYYSDLIPVAVKAIQEQQDIIDSQQKTIQKLEKSQVETNALLKQLLQRIDFLEGKN